MAKQFDDPRDLWNNPDWLHEMHHVKNIPVVKMKDIAGCSDSVMRTRMHKFGIPIKSREEILRDKWNDPELPFNDSDWLYQKYHEDGLSTQQIATEVGVCYSTIRNRMEKFDIEFRSYSDFMKIRWEDEDYKEYISACSKNNWEDEDYRDVMIQKVKEQWNDPEFRKVTCAAASRNLKRLWENPEFSKNVAESMSRRSKELWADPEYVEKARERMTGENNHQWLGGKAFEPYTPDFNFEFKEYIRDRENRECFICSKPESEEADRLDVHHIDYDKVNTTPENCVALCKKCHGKTTKNRKKWEKRLNTRLAETYILT